MQRQMQSGRSKKRLGLAFLALTLGVLLLPGSALAVSKYWIANNGIWSYAGNWNPAGVPVTGDDVFLTQSGTTSKAVTYKNSASPTPLLNSLTIDATNTGNMILNHTTYADPLASTYEYVGYDGKGTHNQSLGSNTISSGLYLGYNSGSTGTYALSGGSLSAPYQYVGYSGTGTFTQSGGTNTVSNSLYLGYSGGGTGTYTLSGGSLSAANQNVGYMGSGTFTHSGGTNTVSGNLYLGATSGVSGSYTLSGASSSFSAGNLYLGNGFESSGAFTHSDTAVNVAGTLDLGTGNYSSSIYTLNSGTLTAGNVNVGAGGYMAGATFNHVGGTSTTQNLTIGNGTGTASYNLHGTLNVNNTLVLNQGGTLSIYNNPGSAVLNFGTFYQEGGAVNGGGIVTVGWGSTYHYNGGSFNARMVNMYNAFFNVDFHATGGLDNQWRISESDRNFTLDGIGLNNRGVFELYGGVIGGNGALVNSGTMILNGDIAGSGDFTNFGHFSVYDYVRLVKTGTHVNYGQIAFGSDFQSAGGHLILSGNTLTNRGLINLSSSYYTSGPMFIDGGTFTNDVGGIIQGAGNITGDFSNAGLLSVAGTMQIYKDFTNTGIIQLGYSSSGGSGGSILMGGQTDGVPTGAIANQGKIMGAGTINSNISNTGVIEGGGGGYGGALVLNGSVTNATTGLITATDMATVLVNQGLASNLGKINLAGGVFDNNGHALANASTGQISGYGVLRTGGTGLRNYGTVNLGGNLAMTTVVDGVVRNGDATHTGARMDLNSYTYFSGLVTNYDGNTVKTYGVGSDLSKATLTFAGGFVNNGTYISDPIIQSSTKDWVNGETGIMIGGPDDGWIIGGSFINRSLMNQEWDTAQSSLIFDNLGYGTAHDLYLAGADLNSSRNGFQDNFAFGTLDITGQQISLVDGNAGNSGSAFYAALLLGAILDGGMVANIDGNGCNLYYDPLLGGNQYLGGGTYALLDGGFLAPVSATLTQTPLPPTVWMLLSGLAGLGLLRRKKGTKN